MTGGVDATNEDTTANTNVQDNNSNNNHIGDVMAPGAIFVATEPGEEDSGLGLGVIVGIAVAVGLPIW